MCEMLISLIDKANPNDPALCARCHKRGDAIVVMPDGHEWSEREEGHEGWRILRLPLVSESEASVFVAPGRVPPDSGRFPPLHAFFIDVDGLPVDEAEVARMDFAALDRLRIPRPSPPDPRHLGPNTREIG